MAFATGVFGEEKKLKREVVIEAEAVAFVGVL